MDSSMLCYERWRLFHLSVSVRAVAGNVAWLVARVACGRLPWLVAVTRYVPSASTIVALHLVLSARFRALTGHVINRTTVVTSLAFRSFFAVLRDMSTLSTVVAEGFVVVLPSGRGIISSGRSLSGFTALRTVSAHVSWLVACETYPVLSGLRAILHKMPRITAVIACGSASAPSRRLHHSSLLPPLDEQRTNSRTTLQLLLARRLLSINKQEARGAWVLGRTRANENGQYMGWFAFFLLWVVRSIREHIKYFCSLIRLMHSI